MSFLNWLQSLFKSKPTEVPNQETNSTAPILKKYKPLWDTCVVNPESLGQVEKIVSRIIEFKDRYHDVSFHTDVPWQIIACIHNKEAGLDFSKCLHNGDPWNKKTTHVPKGRGPFDTWEDSAIDAVAIDNLDDHEDWDIETTLRRLEAYNGTGYLKYHKDVNTPYLWACTNHYTKGQYVEDGKFDPNAVAKNPGVAAILKSLQSKGLYEA